MPAVYDPRTGTLVDLGESKWFVPEQQLNSDQQRFLSQSNFHQRNLWIKGFAGSGKSILLIHVARQVLNENSNSRIILVVYTQALVEMFKTALRELNMTSVPVMTYFAFYNSNRSYDYILCDEVQDLTPKILNAMYERSAHLIVAGDSNQSIYEKDPRWFENTVEVDKIPGLIHGGDFELTIVERLTESVMKAVKKLLSFNLFSAKVNLANADTKITLCKASSEMGEVKYIVERATKNIQNEYTTAILIPTQRRIVDFVNSVLTSKGKLPWSSTLNQYGKVDFGAMNSYLTSQGIKMQYVGNGYGSFKDNADYIVLMTYHSSKGLDFDFVYLPYCNNQLWISYNATKAKSLFLVAMTRSRMNLYITYNGYPHSYVNNFASDCSQKTI